MGAPSLPLLIIIINGGHFDYLDLGCFSKQHEDFCWPKIEFQITPSRLYCGFSTHIPSPPHPPNTFSSTGTMGKVSAFSQLTQKNWLLVLAFGFVLFLFVVLFGECAQRPPAGFCPEVAGFDPSGSKSLVIAWNQ